MNKTEFIARLAEKANISQKDARAAVDSFADVIVEELKKDEKISILGLGTFSVSDRPARQGINPQTKEKIQIAARKVVKFKPAAALDLNEK